jgi:formylmethanofuran dehydrogenase subunit D
MNEVSVNVNPKNIKEVSADERGRVTLGSEFAGETVVVAVVEDDE